MNQDRHAHHQQHGDRYAAEATPFIEEKEMSALECTTMATLRDLLRLSPDALIVVSHEGSIVFANKQMVALFGYRQEELIGQPLECLLPERFRTAHVAHRTTYTAAPRMRSMGAGLNLFGKRKDGSEFPVDISLRPVLVGDTVHVIGAIRDMTIQRLLEQERLQQAERLRMQADLINLSRDAILVRDPISRILSWNHGAEELYGWTAQEVLGRITHTLLKTRFSGSQATIDAQLEREGRWEGELHHIHRDGHVVIVESRQVLIRNPQGSATAILEINRDITERRQVEQAQSRIHATTISQRTFLQQILDSLPSSIYVVHGKDARLVLANRAAATIWGAVWPLEQPMQTFLETHTIAIVDQQGQQFPSEAWATMRALLHGETVFQHQEFIRQPTGKSLPILVNAVPLTSAYWHSVETPETQENQPHEQEPLALVVHQDVSALKETEYLKDEFIGIAAHELRTPLAILKTSVSSMIVQTARGHGPQLADWQQEMLQDIEYATDRLTDLTEDLLDVTRLQAGQIVLQRAPTNMISLAQRVVERFRQTATRHHLELRTEHTTLEAPIDPRRIEQVLTNLLSNAIKYSPQGGPVTVQLEANIAAQSVDVRVQDAGIGIPQQQQAQIFGRFMRADNAKAAGITGTGLGLYLCRTLIEQHGGRLWFESKEGKGTTFFLTLPLATPDTTDTISYR
ncbi:PAS domain S-box protein [Ktedonobacter sp. SOSP1-85]|uniref:sensor histidine kinase n=1 Tax=Ktedonobacter sp. SOSP1-85 TaxID=2778367 RepID=UPI001915ABAA|nr:PAS domain S-box protein [Ktedonobacter sp. SOSP1-85]